MDPRSTLQPFQAAQRPGHDRPADRLGHRLDERPPVGGHDDRRRKLCRCIVLLPPQGDGRQALRHALLPAHAPRPRRRERALLGDPQGGRHRPGQLPLRHHEGPHRVPPLPRRRLHDRRRGRHAARNPLQGRDGPRQTGEDPQGEPQGEDPVRGADHHQQHGRRPARFDAQHPRDVGTLPPLRRARPVRLGPLRRERLLHQDARGGLCRQEHQGDRTRDLQLCRHDDHFGQEGRRGEHGRFRGHALRGALPQGNAVQHHVRRLPHLRRHVGPRHGRARRGSGREHRVRTARRPHPAGETAGRPARRVRRPLPASCRRSCDLHRRQEDSPQPAEGGVHRPDARHRALPRSGHPRRGDRLDPCRPRSRDSREPLSETGVAASGHSAPGLHGQSHPRDRRRLPQHLRAPRVDHLGL